MKKRVFVSAILVLVLSWLLASFAEGLLLEDYAASGSIASISFPGSIDGFLFSYVFLASLIISVFSGRLRTGLYWSLPVLVIDIILGAFNPQLWMSLMLILFGLALAWLILAIKKRFALTK